MARAGGRIRLPSLETEQNAKGPLLSTKKPAPLCRRDLAVMAPRRDSGDKCPRSPLPETLNRLSHCSQTEAGQPWKSCTQTLRNQILVLLATRGTTTLTRSCSGPQGPPGPGCSCFPRPPHRENALHPGPDQQGPHSPTTNDCQPQTLPTPGLTPNLDAEALESICLSSLPGGLLRVLAGHWPGRSKDSTGSPRPSCLPSSTNWKLRGLGI